MTTIPNFGDKVGYAAGAVETFTPPGIIQTGKGPEVFLQGVLVDQNAVLPIRSVVGRITSSGKLTFCDPSASDGSQVPVGITSTEAPDVSGDQTITIMKDGYWNPAALNYDQTTGGFASVAALQIALEARCPGLILKTPATGTPGANP